MAIIVQKYGGSSVADIDKIKKVARKVVDRKRQGFDLVVVVSAMGGTTDQLIGLARQIHEEPARREMDMLVSVGERITISLLSMAIHALGEDSISFTGSQSGIITNDSHNRARIIDVRPFRIQDELERGRVVIIAGYQGVSYKREITTLGRGGTDTTAIALTASLDAECCEIYSDVDGVYTADPRLIDDARKLDEITYDEMLALSKNGARVLNSEAVAYAKRHGIAIHAKSTFGTAGQTGTIVRKDLSIERPLAGVSAQPRSVVLESSQPVSAEDYLRLIQLAEEHCVPWSYLQFCGQRIFGYAQMVDIPEPAGFLADLAANVPAIESAESDGTASLVGETLQEGRYLTRALSCVSQSLSKSPSYALTPNCLTVVAPIPALQSIVSAWHSEFF